MTFQEIRRLVKCIPVEALLYGRIPLMTSSGCIIKGATGVCSCERPTQLRDRRASYPLARAYKCRSTLYSADKLFLPGKRRYYERLGLWCARLAFTTESPEECVLVTQRYLGQNQFEPTAKTKGLYL
jgi:putative protease